MSRPRQPTVTTSRLGLLVSVLCVAIATATGPARAATCSRDDFASAVDRAGAALRAFNSEHGPKVAAEMKALQKRRGWSDAEFEAKAIELIHDARIGELDQKANDLISRIDTLGEIDDKKPLDCSRLPALEAAGSDLLATMREKSKLTLAKIAAASGEPQQAVKPAAPATDQARPAPTTPASRDKAGEPAPADKPGSWKAATKHEPATTPAPPAAPPAAAAPADRDVAAATRDAAPAMSDPPVDAQRLETEDTFTIDEIRAATRGIFGTLSTNLASVIEYAFATYGRPTGYVLGSEGGGAFLAGARFGKGDLFMRRGEKRQVYWHGPSLGYDFGAEGSRTLFLIYKLEAADDLYRLFVGIDGSAYVIGGVGLTLLKGGPVLMAPIRTGVGLRLGASIGYVRFTPHATWNPF